MEHATPGILLLMILFIGPVLYYISKAKKGATYFLRRIRGIDEIDAAIGRATEDGRPVCFSTGMTTVNPLFFACLGILHHIAEKVAKLRSSIIVPEKDPEALALIDATLQNAYQNKGRLSHYDPSQVRFLSSDQLAYASGYQGIMHREKPGAAFLFGSFAAESLILAESGQQVGAMQIAGTVSNEQIPFFITSCDYTLLGDEVYAASAYLSKEPTQLGSIRGQDIAKLSVLLLIVSGVILESMTASGLLNLGPSYIRTLFSKDWETVFLFMGES
jgi:hypothetical protein